MYDEDYYDSIEDDSQRSAAVIVPMFLDLVQPKSVVDFGCGAGHFLKPCLDAGIEDVVGVDQQYFGEGVLPKEKFHQADLTLPLNLHRKFDLAICVEVAEHLHESKAARLIETLTSHSSVILFSAAVPMQGGEGHYNERWPEYWQWHFNNHGFTMSGTPRLDLWQNRRVSYWYRQNLFLVVDDTLQGSRKSDDPNTSYHAIRHYMDNTPPFSMERLIHSECWGSKLGVSFQ